MATPPPGGPVPAAEVQNRALSMASHSEKSLFFALHLTLVYSFHKIYIFFLQNRADVPPQFRPKLKKAMF